MCIVCVDELWCCVVVCCDFVEYVWWLVGIDEIFFYGIEW